jgi:hypothetical protein
MIVDTIKVSRSGRQQSCCNQRGRPVGNYLKPKVFPVGASTCANPGDAKKVIAGGITAIVAPLI